MRFKKNRQLTVDSHHVRYLYNPGDHATITQLSDTRHLHTVISVCLLPPAVTVYSTLHIAHQNNLQHDTITAIICQSQRLSLLASIELCAEILAEISCSPGISESLSLLIIFRYHVSATTLSPIPSARRPDALKHVFSIRSWDLEKWCDNSYDTSSFYNSKQSNDAIFLKLLTSYKAMHSINSLRYFLLNGWQLSELRSFAVGKGDFIVQYHSM